MKKATEKNILIDGDFIFQKIRHELCFAYSVNVTNQFGIYNVHMPYLTDSGTTASDARAFFQKALWRHLIEGSQANKFVFDRAMIHVCSEPSTLDLVLSLRCLPEQISTPTESEITKAFPYVSEANSLLSPKLANASDVRVRAWGINDYIYDVVVDMWPHRGQKHGLAGMITIKYINSPIPDATINVFDESVGIKFDIGVAGTWVPIYTTAPNSWKSFLEDAKIDTVQHVEYEDGIGRELIVTFEVAGE